MPALLRGLDDHMGPAWEESFREHLRRLAVAGQLGEDVVAVGPWWQADGGNEIDAVVLAQPDRTRIPVAVGEAKWAKRIEAPRLRGKLTAKAAALTDDFADLRYVLCAREEVTGADPTLLTITAADIFTP
jgi:hypothetical protein